MSQTEETPSLGQEAENPYVLFFEPNDKERTAEVTLARNGQSVLLTQIEMTHLASVLLRQLKVWNREQEALH